MLALGLFALLQLAAQPVPSPSASPLPTPRVTLAVSGSNVFIDQATGGPGITPPEASEFAHGSPISPMSPYDWLSSAPVVPGVAGVAQYEISATYHAGPFDFATTFGIGGLTGSTTNALYWSELIPNLNAHALSRVVPYSIVFPTHAGQDDATVGNASLLNASATSDDGRWKVQGGYFNLTQTDRFIFAPPPVTSVSPSLGAQTAETLGSGAPAIDAWQPAASTLPLLGADGVFHQGAVTVELTDALLPSPAGTNLRAAMGSLVLDRGDAGRFSIQLGHFWTSGGTIATTTYFGTNRQIYQSVQGRLFTSELGSQTQTIAGARAFFHPLKGWDAVAELGRAWYDASLVTYPGTARFGNYEHFSIARRWNNDAVTLEYHRFDPTYATLIAPYGIPENIWSIAWSWPGIWLKSNYQLVDNSVTGANRAGFRIRYDRIGTAVEVHASYGDWRQLIPETIANASQVGFVDGFFLLQKNPFGTIGRDRQAALYLAWHLPRDDFTFDAVEDYLSRPADAGQPIDVVATRYPQAVLSWAHHFNKNVLAVGGYGRFAAAGTWAVSPVDAVYGLGFLGVEFATGPKTAFLVQARRYALVGVPSIPYGPPPTMRGTSLIVDQRIAL